MNSAAGRRHLRLPRGVGRNDEHACRREREAGNARHVPDRETLRVARELVGRAALGRNCLREEQRRFVVVARHDRRPPELSSAQVLPAVYDVTMTYASRSMTQTGIVVNAATTVPFTTHTLTVQLLAAGGAGLSGGSVSATPAGGSAFSLGTTNSSGIVTATVLDGPYTISMTYNSSTVDADADTERRHDDHVPDVDRRAADALVDGDGDLTGQDSAIWWRPAGTSSWNFAGYPDSSGNVSLSMLPGSYDFEARWFGVYEVKSAVAITAGSTVTWTDGRGDGVHAGVDGFGVDGSGQCDLGAAGGRRRLGSSRVIRMVRVRSCSSCWRRRYDFEARWFGVYEVKSAVSISADTTVTWQAVAATEYMRASTGSGLTGQDSAIWVRPRRTSVVVLLGVSEWFGSGRAAVVAVDV